MSKKILCLLVKKVFYLLLHGILMSLSYSMNFHQDNTLRKFEPYEHMHYIIGTVEITQGIFLCYTQGDVVNFFTTYYLLLYAIEITIYLMFIYTSTSYINL